MIKVMALMKRREDMSFEDFRKWILDDHVAFARNLPGLKKYTSNVLLSENPDAPFDGVSEMYFEDEAAMAAAFATDAGKAAGGDAAGHCSHRFRMVCQEKPQF
ncbi:MAG: EthD family reductase [Mesorhizobium sp.]|jgi:uncharacterized protein (TIGR02118 family)